MEHRQQRSTQWLRPDWDVHDVAVLGARLLDRGEEVVLERQCLTEQRVGPDGGCVERGHGCSWAGAPQPTASSYSDDLDSR